MSYISGYSLQYLRCLLRNSKLVGIKAGQMLQIDKGALNALYRKNVRCNQTTLWPKVVFYFPGNVHKWKYPSGCEQNMSVMILDAGNNPNIFRYTFSVVLE
jgi:hypothetical protein